MYFAFVLEGLSGPVVEYARGMEAGLRELGHQAAVVQGAAALPPGARPLLDGRLLPALRAERDALLARGAAALFHDPGALVGPGSGPERAALHEWLPRLGRIVATSTPAADLLAAEADVGGGRLAVIPPGVTEAGRSAGSGGTGCAVLAVSPLAPETGHDALLRALARLPDLDWSLAVAGGTGQEPGLAGSLREQAQALGIAERFRLHADPDPAALQALWEGADVFALAARPGGCVGAVAEAIRRGVPVATTEGAGGVPGGAGTTTPVGDDAALSKCLRRLIFDTPMRQAMAEAAWRAGQALPTWPAQAALLAAHLG